MSIGEVERRKWRCPGCERVFKIPNPAEDPSLCPKCTKANKSSRPTTNVPDPRFNKGDSREELLLPEDQTHARGRLPAMITTGIGVSVLFLFLLNSLFLNTDGEDDHSIIEPGPFGQPSTPKESNSQKGRHKIGDRLKTDQSSWSSENFNRWNESSRLSELVSSVLISIGPDLLEDPSLESERMKTAKLSRAAYESANQIPAEYLRASNPELPEQYVLLFAPSMKLWAEGLEERNLEKVLDGIDHYNAFVLWIKSKNRSDFKLPN